MIRLRDSAIFVFFFQAEDGIRDLTVTGVQTCALPISAEVMGVNTTVSKALAYMLSAVLAAVGGAVIGYKLTNMTTEAEALRSEERRVGEEGRSRWAPDH